MERYINIHSHYLPPFDEEVWTIINIQERDYSFRPTTNFTSNLKGSLGIHPWYIDSLNYKNQLMKVESMLTQNQYVAIGEAGLDRNINTPLDLQIEIFTRQIEWSEKYRLPMIIHCVRAFQDIIAIKKKLNPQMSWIFHGFNHKKSFYQLLEDNGCYISIGTSILNSKSVLNSYFQDIDLSRLFLETDDKDISIKTIYNKIMFLKSMDLESLILAFQKNYIKTFLKP